jgi:hypothetical protein
VGAVCAAATVAARPEQAANASKIVAQLIARLMFRFEFLVHFATSIALFIAQRLDGI